MRILLIEPPFDRLKKVKTFYFPIGLGYIATVLNKEGFYARIYNAELGKETFPKIDKNFYEALLDRYPRYISALNNDNHYVWKEIKHVIKNFKPDIVGITTKTAKYPSAIKIAKLCKSLDKDSYVVLGGPHPTIMPTEVMKNKEIDFLIRGEGEQTFLELCTEIKTGKHRFNDIKGLSFKKSNEIVHNSDRSLIADIDTLPIINRSLVLRPELYTPRMMGDIVTSRGCPYNCSFCSQDKIWKRKVRFRSLDMVIKEIALIKNKFNTKYFYFWDDTFTFNRKRTMALCKRLMKSKFDINWGCTTRVDAVDNDLLKLMKNTGCGNIDIGIESGSQRMLDLMNKRITVKQVLNAVDLINRNNILCNTFFMAGLPDETKEDLEKTINLIRHLNVSIVCLSIYTPYPGSPFYYKLKKDNLIPKNYDWAKFSHHSPYNWFSSNISQQEFIEIVRKISVLVDKKNNRFLRKVNSIRHRIRFFLRNPHSLITLFQEYFRIFQ